MLIAILNVLDVKEVACVHELLRDATWSDGRSNAGDQATQAKNNLQLPKGHATTAARRQVVLKDLVCILTLFRAARPRRIGPPAAQAPWRGRQRVRQPHRQRGAHHHFR